MVQMAGLASCRFLSVPRGAGELRALRRLRRVLPRRRRTIGMQRMPGEHGAVLRDEQLQQRKRLLVHARCVLLQRADSLPKIPKAMNAEGGYLSYIAGFFNAKSAAGEVRLLERLHALEAGEV